MKNNKLEIEKIRKKFDSSNHPINSYVRRIEKPWGYEIIYTRDNAPATGKILHVKAGAKLSTQFHDQKIETMCLFRGRVILFLSDESDNLQEIEMKLLEGYQINIGQLHSIKAIEDSAILESSMPEVGNTYRINDDYGRNTETEEMRSLPNREWNEDA